MKEVLRMCCVCREKQNKYDMTRIVYKDGVLMIDNNKQSGGKATYVCKKDECKENLIKKKTLNRIYKCSITQESYNKISEELNIASTNNK